ncbi:MAG: hypothetical protein IH948_09475, partial [Bacteroidetes bacterium]|nr:hypothetical protein [Bacteroidota bacterium]
MQQLQKIALILTSFLPILDSYSQIGDCSNSSIQNYIHISHTRLDSNPKMDSVVESAEYKNFDMILLGGDLAKQTSLDDITMSHVDSFFNFS